MTLPSTDKLKRISKVIAFLDAVLMQEWEYRYFSHNSKWGNNEEMGSMRDGEGNYYFILFKEETCFIKTIQRNTNNQDKIMNYLEKIEKNERELVMEFLNEPAFYVEEITELLWNLNGNWNVIKYENIRNLQIFENFVQEYKSYVQEYFEKQIEEELIYKVLNDEITLEEILIINPKIDITILLDDIDEIGMEIIKKNIISALKPPSYNSR